MRGDLSSLYFRSAKEHALPTLDRIEDYDLLSVLTPKTTIIYARMASLSGFREFMAMVAWHSNVYLDTFRNLVAII